MNVTITLADNSPFALMVQHLADAAQEHVEDWAHNLIIDAVMADPHTRECSNKTCAEIIYPSLLVRPVADGIRRSAITPIAIDTCPRCGSLAIRPRLHATA